MKSEMANFDTVFSDALSETNDAIDAAVPRTTEEYNKLWNDLMAKQQDEQDGVAQMSAHDKEMLKIMPFVRSLVDVRELFAEADKSQSRLKALEDDPAGARRTQLFGLSRGEGARGADCHL